MADPRPLPPPDRDAPGPSLAGRAIGMRPRLSRPTAIVAALATIALLAAAIVWTAATRIEAETIRLRQDRPRPTQPEAMPEPIGAILTSLERALPSAARIAELSRHDRLTAVIETPEPDRLRAALAADPALSRLRTTGEAALPDGGYRVTLEEPR